MGFLTFVRNDSDTIVTLSIVEGSPRYSGNQKTKRKPDGIPHIRSECQAGAWNDGFLPVTLSMVEGSPNQSANPKLLRH